MATRIDIELTSRRDETTFTWRAAGAREPKGVVEASLFPADAEVGAEYRVEADVELDGITITNVVPAKEPKSKPIETLELLGSKDEPLVTQQLARKPRGDQDRKGKGKRRRQDRDDHAKSRGDSGRDRGQRAPAKPKLPPKPKPPRLKAGRGHRKAMLESLPDEQQPVAEELFSGGLKAVRSALAKQNEQFKTEGKPQIDETPILTLAEQLLSKVRVAEWMDRAEAALDQAKEVDLRDLRAVVTAADGVAKDDETRSLAASLRTALAERLDAEHHEWVKEIADLLEDDRVVRALHLSSRPPKAGAPLPAPVAVRLVDATNAALSSDVSSERWGYTIDALAHSPIRHQVVPASLPSQLTDELKALIARHGHRLPELAEIFGIEPDPAAGRGKPRNRRKPRKPESKDGAKGKDDAKANNETTGDAKDKGPGTDEVHVAETAAEDTPVDRPGQPVETGDEQQAAESETAVEDTGPATPAENGSDTDAPQPAGAEETEPAPDATTVSAAAEAEADAAGTSANEGQSEAAGEQSE